MLDKTKRVALLIVALLLFTSVAFALMSQGTFKTLATGPTTIFQDNFDSYSPGPLPTGTGTNQWTMVKTVGTGFAVDVASTQAKSAPNSLQITLGNVAKGHAWAQKNYTAGTFSHGAQFNLYLDASLNLSGQPIVLFTAENPAQPVDGLLAVWLAPNHHLQVIRYDSTGKKHTIPTATALSLGQWYSLEVDQFNDAVHGNWSLLVGGTKVAGEINVDTGNTLVTAIRVGDTISSLAGMSGSVYVDDVLTSILPTQGIGGIFQDNFDSYSPGPLPTGTGTNQWTSVNVKGSGFGVNVSNARASSAPNSLQITLGSGRNGFADAEKDYAASTGYATHDSEFKFYFDTSLNQGGQSIILFTAQNLSLPTNGSAAVWLAANHHLQVIRYDSLGGRQVIPTSTVLQSGQWYTIELDQTNAAVNGSWSLWVNGTQIAGETSVDTGNTQITSIIAGDTRSSLAVMSGAFYEDDVITSTQHIG